MPQHTRTREWGVEVGGLKVEIGEKSEIVFSGKTIRSMNQCIDTNKPFFMHQIHEEETARANGMGM